MPLVLQIPVKTTIKQSKDTCSPAPFFKFASLWWFNLLFPKVLIKPFLTWLIWIAAKKEHLVPHPMSGDFVLILNILHSSHTGKIFWNELLCCSQEWTFFVCIFSQFLDSKRFWNVMIHMKVMNSVCNKMKIKPKCPAHSKMPCDPMRSQQFQICFYSINLCSNTLMNNWGLILRMSYSFASIFYYSFPS